MKNKWSTDKRVRFYTGVGFQLAQAGLITLFVLAQMDWTFVGTLLSPVIQNMDKILVGIAVLVYNIISWWLIINGTRREE